MTSREQADTGFNHRPSTCQPGSVNLQQYLMQRFGLGDSGCYNPNSMMSGGGPSWHVFGKAIDLTCDWNDPVARGRGLACWQWIVDHREDLNLQQMIFGDRIVDVSDGHQLRYYGGGDHGNHIHCAIGYQASQSWQPSSAPAPAPPKPKRGRRMNLIQYHGGNAIAITDGLTKRILATPSEYGEMQWLIGVQGGNPGVTFVSQSTWDALPTVHV